MIYSYQFDGNSNKVSFGVIANLFSENRLFGEVWLNENNLDCILCHFNLPM